jgi:hypothetical protein
LARSPRWCYDSPWRTRTGHTGTSSNPLRSNAKARGWGPRGSSPATTGTSQLDTPAMSSRSGWSGRVAQSFFCPGWGRFVWPGHATCPMILPRSRSSARPTAAQYGRTVVVIDRFAPTSQVCSVCGVKDGPKSLQVREWDCTACGSHLDRDYNAAVNIMVAAGLAETLNACGGNVRLALASAIPSEAGTHRTDPTHGRAA